MSDEQDPVIDEVITELMQEMPEPGPDAAASPEGAPPEEQDERDAAPDDESPPDERAVDLAEENRRLKQQVGRLGGRLGHLQQQLQSRAPASSEPFQGDAAPVLDSDTVAEVSRETLMELQEKFPDLEKDARRLIPYLDSFADDIAAAADTGSKRYVRATIVRAIGDARRALAREDAMQTRRADSLRNLDEARKKATPPAAGVSSAPRQQPRSLNDMSVNELDAMLKNLPRP